MGQDDPEQRIAELERQHAEAVSVSRAGLGDRWRLARGMVRGTDRRGVHWRVYRRWFPNWNLSFLHYDLGEFGAVLLAVLWPPWFIGKCFGARWIISIERNGSEVGVVRVRGWRKSQQRIHELAEAVATGTPQQELVAEKCEPARAVRGDVTALRHQTGR
ncbi:hypothetical protein [Mycolicibacterium gadium]|uniref:DUF304 domain-containing protein n=1 Tax=Mycolicibacterium gadium TaxID=1794 RepID=A0ABT6GX77_MYCGU|nr:hypothetical protein [Mycolicibacterium gadium]MDG5486249.1 hypothetical protein [Mycolicibacterium gadium]